MDLPPVPLWRVKSPPCKSGVSRHRLANRVHGPRGQSCRPTPDLPAPNSDTREKHQIPPAAAGAPRTWHMNPGMILWKQDPL